jgi:putative membrane protein
MAQAPLREVPAHFLRGMAMGSADVVPGVSGGTVALVLAIYRRLITAIRTGSSALGHVLKLDVRGGWARLRAVDWLFLIPLGLGILTAVLLLAGAIEHQLEVHPVQMSGLFMGLVAGSTAVATGLLTRRDLREWTLILGAGAAFFVALGFTAGSSAEGGSGDTPLWAFLVSGAIAICAMILPGVSGSFLLVVMGMYSAVLAAVNDRDLVTIGVFALGCVVGLALFSQLLHWALNKHYDTVMAVMIGLMLGSLRVLWPWPDGANSVALGAPDEAVAVTVGLALFGLGLVLVVDRIAHRIERRRSSDEIEELQAS